MRSPGFIFGICALSLGASGCLVPAKQLDEAKSALSLEQEAHRKTADRVYALTREVDSVQQKLKGQELATEQRDLEQAQTQFDFDIVKKEREAADALVEQLRGELERMGSHLKAYAGEREQLAERLALAELRAEQLARVERVSQAQLALMKELSIGFYKDISAGAIRLGSERGIISLDSASKDLFDEQGLSPLGRQRMQSVAKLAVGNNHVKFRIEISERGAGDNETALLRLSQVAEVLAVEGASAGAGIDSDQVTVSIEGDSAALEEPSKRRVVLRFIATPRVVDAPAEAKGSGEMAAIRSF